MQMQCGAAVLDHRGDHRTTIGGTIGNGHGGTGADHEGEIKDRGQPVECASD